MSFEPLPSENEPASMEPNRKQENPTLADEACSQPATIVADTKDERLGFLHWSSVFFDIARIIQQQLIPLILSVYFGQNYLGFWFAILIVGTTILIPAVISIYQFLTLKYHVKDGKLIIEKGLLFKTVRTIPIEKIQNLDLTQRMLHRIFKVAEVRIETAGGAGVEAVLRVITVGQVEQLKRWISAEPVASQPKNSLTLENGSSPEVESVNQASSELLPRENRGSLDSDSPQEVIKVPVSWLLKAGLSTNQGLVFLGLAASAIYQYGDKIIAQFAPSDSIRQYQNMATDFWETSSLQTFALGLVAVLLVLFLITRLTGIAWYIVRFSGYRLQKKKDEFIVSFGLWTKITATVPKRRIQFVSVHRPIFFRLFGLSVIRIETAGGSDENKNMSSVNAVRECFVPVLPDHQVDSVLKEIRDGLYFPDQNEGDWKGLSPRATSRKLRRVFLQAILGLTGAGLATYLFSISWPIPIIATLLAFHGYWAYRSSKTVKYVRTPLGLIYKSGVFNKKMSIAFADRIQAVNLSQTFFDRRWKMATLSVDTAAAGAARHVIEIPYLDEEFAFNEFQFLNQYVADKLIPISQSTTLPFQKPAAEVVPALRPA